MKRIFTVLMLSGLLFVFTACGQTAKEIPPDTDKGTQQNTIATEPTDAGSDSTTGKAETQSSGNPARADNNKSGSNVIIAKSDNIVSSEDKAAVLEKLDNELDELFTGMNELEDIEDSDLE